MRIRSLDVARGLILVFTVIVVSPIDGLPDWWIHGEWSGIYLKDYVFPPFVFLSGAGMAFLYRKNVPRRATVRRFTVLFICGLLYNGILGHSQLVNWRIPGVLQAYAVMTVVFYFLHKYLRTIRAWMIATSVAVIGHSLFLLAFMFRCPGHELSATCNPSRSIDFRIFTKAHVYAQGASGFDYEGVIGVTGIMITGMFGATSGHLILKLWKSQGSWKSVAFWYGLMVALTGVTLLLVPPIKIMWTGSFACLMALWIAPILFGLFYLLDQQPWTRAKEIAMYPLISMGRNPLVFYFGFHFFNGLLMMSGADRDLRIDVGLFFCPWNYNIGMVGFNLVFWPILAMFMYRHKVFVHA